LNSRRFILSTALTIFGAISGFAQVTPAAGFTPPVFRSGVKVGGTIFGDFTYQESPEAKDADGNTVNLTSFNIGRAYLNITGQLNHRLVFRITPDIARESGSGSSLSGSLNYRLKYAYGQFNLDDWTTKGSWVRFGMQQTPYVDYTEGIYRYRFQGPIFVDREGFLGSSDAAISGRWVFPGNYGDVHAGIYNGEGYNKAEPNDQKAFMIRGSVRPLPLGGVLKGLRVTGFYDADNYVQDAKRERLVGQLVFEHPRVNAAIEVLDAKDQTSASKPEVHSTGYSVWATPKLAHGFELLLRHDQLNPDKATDQRKNRNIAGIAYWPTLPKGVTAAFMLDYDAGAYDRYATARPDETRYGVKVLLNF
jgi:hypothetical protein